MWECATPEQAHARAYQHAQAFRGSTLHAFATLGRVYFVVTAPGFAPLQWSALLAPAAEKRLDR